MDKDQETGAMTISVQQAHGIFSILQSTGALRGAKFAYARSRNIAKIQKLARKAIKEFPVDDVQEKMMQDELQEEATRLKDGAGSDKLIAGDKSEDIRESYSDVIEQRRLHMSSVHLVNFHKVALKDVPDDVSGDEFERLTFMWAPDVMDFIKEDSDE